MSSLAWWLITSSWKLVNWRREFNPHWEPPDYLKGSITHISSSYNFHYLFSFSCYLFLTVYFPLWKQFFTRNLLAFLFMNMISTSFNNSYSQKNPVRKLILITTPVTPVPATFTTLPLFCWYTTEGSEFFFNSLKFNLTLKANMHALKFHVCMLYWYN